MTTAAVRTMDQTTRGCTIGIERVLLLDPGLFFEGGHHATFARLVRDECVRRGIGCKACGLRRIDHPPAGIEIRNLFRTSAYAKLGHGDPLVQLRAFNREVLEDLRLLPREDLRAGTLLLVPTLTSRIALGMVEWLASLPADAPPAALILMFSPGWSGDDALRSADLSIYTEAMRALSALPPGRVALFAETEPVARVFERLGAPPVRMLSWPVMLDDPDEPAIPYGVERLPAHVVHLGFTKSARGIELLADTIPGVLEARPGVSFTVQANYWDPAGVEPSVRKIAEMGPRVRVLRGPMEPGDYAARLREADIVVLPYQSRSYAGLGSGVFAEAAACGKVIVLPSGTWIAEQAAKWGLGVVVFDRHEPEALNAALLEAVDRRDELLERAARARPAWASDRGAPAFLDRVLESIRTSREVGRGPRVATKPEEMLRPADDFLVDGMWTPQTQMLRSIRDWVLMAPDEPRTALSIDRNPTLSEILQRRWPSLKITEARWPEFDAQDLSDVPDASCDLVFSHQVLEHIPKPWKAAAELVRVMRPGGLAVHTTCAANPRHGPPAFNDYYRFLPDGLVQLFNADEGAVEVCVKAGWGNRQALAYNAAIDDGHGVLGGRRFVRAIGEPNDENFPWATWIIFRKP
jgi:glycosyltransferase involved in cell wall biosynthesis